MEKIKTIIRRKKRIDRIDIKRYCGNIKTKQRRKTIDEFERRWFK